MLRFLSWFFALSLAVAAGASDTGSAVVWIDVRSHEEHALDAIPGDPNLPHDRIAEGIAAVVPDKSTSIALYCSSGMRSFVARQTLTRLGYTNVRNAGGIDEARAERAAGAGAASCC